VMAMACLLSKRPQWCPQISIRLQLRGSDGFASSSLVTTADRTITLLTSYNIVLGAYWKTPQHVNALQKPRQQCRPRCALSSSRATYSVWLDVQSSLPTTTGSLR